jgi:hypothetical protein
MTEVDVKVEGIRKQIEAYWKDIPINLKAFPEVQKECLENLLHAELAITKEQLTPEDIIGCQIYLSSIEIEMRKARARNTSSFIIGAAVYIAAIITIISLKYGFINFGIPASELNNILFLGIPIPVWIWAIIGSITSVLFRVGQFPFIDVNEAIRWLMFRPIAGVIMGVLSYLMVAAGLIVFTGNSSSQTPELIWVIAFAGSFSDSLSIDLLQKIIGEFQHLKKP